MNTASFHHPLRNDDRLRPVAEGIVGNLNLSAHKHTCAVEALMQAARKSDALETLRREDGRCAIVSAEASAQAAEMLAVVDVSKGHVDLYVCLTPPNYAPGAGTAPRAER